MLHIKEPTFATQTRLTTRDLALHRHWLDAVLRDQDRILEPVHAPHESRDAPGWARRWASLQGALLRHFNVEHTVLAPAVRAMELRAHTVIAETCRTRIWRDLEDPSVPAWEDDGLRVQRLGQASRAASHSRSSARTSRSHASRKHAGAELSRHRVAMSANDAGVLRGSNDQANSQNRN